MRQQKEYLLGGKKDKITTVRVNEALMLGVKELYGLTPQMILDDYYKGYKELAIKKNLSDEELEWLTIL